MKPLRIYVCSNTHWDREWHMPFSEFQSRLVHLLDTLIELLQREPQYRVFNLDGQTVCVEDYLDLRPERADAVRALVQAGRLVIGPWYNLPDEFLTGDELLVRNLLMGRAIAASFGRCSQVGYLPDEFGHIAQMPQILNGFGIDNAIIWRGISSATLPSEFFWEAPDGSAVLTHRINERVGYGIGWFGHWAIHSALGADVPLDEFKKPAVKAHWCVQLVKLFAQRAVSDVIYFPNGTDHTFPDAQVPDWLARARVLLPASTFHHASFDEYMAALREAVRTRPVPRVRGELRAVNCVPYTPDRPIPVNLVLNGVTSTRMDVKLAHHACEQLLQYEVEPLVAWAALAPGVPGGHCMHAVLRRAWRELLRNQPHDSICACSTDAVAADLLTRFRHCQQYARAARHEALTSLFAAYGITPAISAGGQSYVLVHPCPHAASHGALVEFQLPEALAQPPRFALADADGAALPAVLEAVSDESVTQVKLGWYEANCRTAAISLAPGVRSGYSMQAVRVVPGQAMPRRRWRTVARATLRNDLLAVTITASGRIDLHDRVRDMVYTDLLSFEDGGDAGDTYTYAPPARDSVLRMQPEITRIEYGGDTPVVRRARVHAVLRVPQSLTATRRARARTLVTLPLLLELAVWDASDMLEVRITVHNTARDHRLRCCVHTGARTQQVWSEGHFDMQSRPHAMPPPPRDAWIEDAPTTFNNKRFVAACDGTRGLAVITHGLQEHQLLPAHAGALAITLLRCVGWLSLPNLRTRACNAGPSIPTPAAQMPGAITFTLGIMPCHDPAMLPAVQRCAARANAAPFTVPIADGSVLRSPRSFIQAEGAAVSAIKRAEDGNGLIVRLWNGTANDASARLTIDAGEIVAARRVRLDETPEPHTPPLPFTPHAISLDIPAKTIVTLRVNLSGMRV